LEAHLVTTQQGSFPVASSGRLTLLLLWGCSSSTSQIPGTTSARREPTAPHPAVHDRMLAPELTG
jgi:hypothetical protein